MSVKGPLGQSVSTNFALNCSFTRNKFELKEYGHKNSIGWLNEWLDIAGFSIRASGWRNLLAISHELTTYFSLEITQFK